MKDAKHPSASDRAHKTMDIQIQRSHDTELRELTGCGPNDSTSPSDAALPTDAKTLCAWIAKSMPPLAWTSHEERWNREYGVFLSSHRASTPKPWSPPLTRNAATPTTTS